MKRRLNSTLRAFLLGVPVLALPTLAAAQTVWNGPSFTFTRPDGVNGALPQYQDCITARVCIARVYVPPETPAGGGIFNSRQEAAFDWHVSPADTEWAFQGLNGNPSSGVTAANHAALIFGTFDDALSGSVGSNIVGRPGVLHLITDNIYLNITFTSWTKGSPRDGGLADARSAARPRAIPPSAGFAYQRSTAGGAGPAPVPTLSTWSLALLAILLIGFSLRTIRQQRQSSI